MAELLRLFLPVRILSSDDAFWNFEEQSTLLTLGSRLRLHVGALMSLVHNNSICISTLTHDLTINVRYIFWHISRSTVLCEKLTSDVKCIPQCVSAHSCTSWTKWLTRKEAHVIWFNLFFQAAFSLASPSSLFKFLGPHPLWMRASYGYCYLGGMLYHTVYWLSLSLSFHNTFQFESRYPFAKQDGKKSIYGVLDSQLSDILLPITEKVFFGNVFPGKSCAFQQGSPPQIVTAESHQLLSATFRASQNPEKTQG